MDGWDPMEDDYNSVSFNSYNRGPGRDMPLDSHPRFRTNQHQGAAPSTDVYVVGLPPELSDQGLRNLFSEYGKVLRCHIGYPKEGKKKRFAFVTFGSIHEAEQAISGIDRKPPYDMHVEFARPRNDQRRKEEAQNNEFEDLKQQVLRSTENNPARSSRPGLLGTTPKQYQRSHTDSTSELPCTDNLAKIQIRVSGENKVVSYVNNNFQEEKKSRFNQSEIRIVEHFMAYGPNNRASGRASVTAGEFRSTDCGVVERRILDTSENYSCSFVTPQLAQLPCTYCKKPGGFRCPRCKAWYCGQSCQLNDWPQHKLICRPLSEDTMSLKEHSVATKQSNGVGSTNVQRQSSHQNNHFQPNRPQKESSQFQSNDSRQNNVFQSNRPRTENSEMFSTNQRSSQMNDTRKGGGGGTNYPTSNQRESTPSKNAQKPPEPDHFKKPAEQGHYDKTNFPKVNNGTRTAQSENFNDKPTASVPEKTENSNFSKGSENGNDQGRGRAVRNCFPNVTKELRRPLRKPGESTTETPAQVQSSMVTEFFRSGSCTVRVCYILSPDEFYIQKTCNEEALSTLLVELHQEATCAKPLNVLLNPGDHCIALFSDGNWYRAKVLKTVDSKSHEVYFVDYGNKDIVQLENIRMLPVASRRLPEQALGCSIGKVIPLKGHWDENGTEVFKTLVSDVELKAHLQSEKNGNAVVDLEDEDGQFVSKWLVDLNEAKESSNLAVDTVTNVETKHAPSTSTPPSSSSTTVAPSSSSTTVAPSSSSTTVAPSSSSTTVSPSNSSTTGATSKSHEVPSLPVKALVLKPPLPSAFSSLSVNSAPFPANVTWIVDDKKLWVCVIDTELTTSVVEASVALASSCDNKSFTPNIGQAVGALSSDGCYYRALVKGKPDASSYEVLFLDYGNEEVVKSVIPLPPALAAFASPALQLQSSQPHHIAVNSIIKLRVDSIDENQAVFVLLNEEGDNSIGRFIGTPWFSGHLIQETSPASSPPISQPQQTPKLVQQNSSPEARVSKQGGASQASPKASKVNPPLPSYLSSLHVQPEPIMTSVTWIVDSQNFWVSISEDSLTTKIIETSVTLTASFDSDSANYSALSGQLVSAKCSADQTCYRAYVKSRSKAGTYRVLFLDFGNEEEVPAVAPLPPQALSFPSPSLQMSASDDIQVSVDQLLLLRMATVETNFVTFTLVDKDGHEISELVGKPWYSGHMVDTNSSSSSSAPALEEKLTMFSSMPKRQLDSEFEAAVVWANSIKEIYLQRTNDASDLERLMANVAKCVDKVKQKLAPIVGQVVLALYSDGLWYRAKVVAVSADEAHVHFIDYGNHALVTLSELQLCPVQLYKEAPYAIHVSVDGLLDSLPLEKAQELVENVWKVKVIGRAHGLPSVQLWGSNGHFSVPSPTETSIETAVPVPVPATAPVSSSDSVTVVEDSPTVTAVEDSPTVTVVEDSPTVAPVEDSRTVVAVEESSSSSPVSASNTSETYCTARFSEQPYVDIPKEVPVNIVVSTVNSPDLIFINYFPSTDSVQKWNVLVTDIQAYCETARPPSNYSPEPAQFCLARFNEDMQWYRAVVLTKLASSQDSYQVLFVDYGNMETLSNDLLLPIPIRFMELPIQAAQCSLYGIILENVWSEEVCSKLRTEMNGKSFNAQLFCKNDEEVLELDVPEVRKKMIDLGMFMPDPKALEADATLATETCVATNTSTSPVLETVTTCDDPCVTTGDVSAQSDVAATTETEESGLTRGSSATVLSTEEVHDLMEQIRVLQEKLACLKPK